VKTPTDLRTLADRLDARQPEVIEDSDFFLFYATRALRDYADLLETPHPNCHVCHQTPEATDLQVENERLKTAMNQLGEELRMVSVRLCNATLGPGDIQRLLNKR
jgi:hypothetical protein